ncbi:hypothetical protein HDV00_010578 [Rhizophlyctis rosea]|nr:hypothetical protein HDV00_010578 [Rhizophlyctis rosea]
MNDDEEYSRAARDIINTNYRRGSLADVTSLPPAVLTPESKRLESRTIDTNPLSNRQKGIESAQSRIREIENDLARQYNLDTDRPGLDSSAAIDAFSLPIRAPRGDLNTTLSSSDLSWTERFPASVPDVRGLDGEEALERLAAAKERGSVVGDLRELARMGVEGSATDLRVEHVVI